MCGIKNANEFTNVNELITELGGPCSVRHSRVFPGKVAGRGPRARFPRRRPDDFLWLPNLSVSRGKTHLSGFLARHKYPDDARNLQICFCYLQFRNAVTEIRHPTRRFKAARAVGKGVGKGGARSPSWRRNDVSVCVYTCACVHRCACTCACACVCTHVYTCVWVCTRVHTRAMQRCTCVHTCTPVRTCACTQACCVTRVHTCTFVQVCAHACMRVHACLHTCASCTRVFAHVCLRVTRALCPCVHACAYTRVRVCTGVCVCACTHMLGRSFLSHIFRSKVSKNKKRTTGEKGT